MLEIAPDQLDSVTGGGRFSFKSNWVAIQGLAGWFQRFGTTAEGRMVQRRGPDGATTPWSFHARVGASRGPRTFPE